MLSIWSVSTEKDKLATVSRTPIVSVKLTEDQQLFFSVVGSLWQLWSQAVCGKADWQAESCGADSLCTSIGRYRCHMHHRSILQLGMKNRTVITRGLWETQETSQKRYRLLSDLKDRIIYSDSPSESQFNQNRQSWHFFFNRLLKK